VQHVVPKSNWSRYFAGLVDCDDDYLNKRWAELYDLRCKVAHNAIIARSDLDRITILVGELKSKLEDAIKRLPQVQVPESEIEQVAENAAGTVSALVGEFIAAWRILEAELFSIAKFAHLSTHSTSPVASAAALQHAGIMEPAQIERFTRLRTIRNKIIHPTGTSVSGPEIQAAMEEIRLLMKSLPGRSLFGG
jgi:hypothetical protein